MLLFQLRRYILRAYMKDNLSVLAISTIRLHMQEIIVDFPAVDVDPEAMHELLHDLEEQYCGPGTTCAAQSLELLQFLKPYCNTAIIEFVGDYELPAVVG